MKHCDNCGKPTAFGETYCPPCERVFGEVKSVGIDLLGRAKGVSITIKSVIFEPADKPELATMSAIDQLLGELVDNPDGGSESAARVIDWITAKYGSRRELLHEDPSH